jgi:radical SAM protein with 4Fe4S-binding SPASM domain
MLNIFLGYACNFSCKYCLQEMEAPDAVRRRHPVEPFIERVVPFVQDHGVKRISYWGGEPLLYWDTIKDIHAAFERAGIAFDFVRMSTNGSLLTTDHVGPLNDWNVHVVISDHGRFGQPDWNMVRRLRRSSISFLFSGAAPEIWPFFARLADLERTYDRPFWPYAHWVRATRGCDPQYWFTPATLERHISHLWELAYLRRRGHRHASSLFEGHLDEWRRGLTRAAGPVEPLCHGRDHLSVDLMGNRYACHHSVMGRYRTGHLFDGTGPRDDGERRAVDHAWQFARSTECRACPVRSWCRGNCHLSQTHEIDCRLSREKHQVLAWLDKLENGPLPRNQIEVEVH